MERNRIELTGTVERLKAVETRTGAPMAKWFLKVGEHRFVCVAFRNLAAVVMAAGDGREIGVVGQGAINSWKTDDGGWRNDFQVTAWSVEVDGVTTSFEKGTIRRPHQKEESGRKQPSATRSRDDFAYRGGPF